MTPEQLATITDKFSTADAIAVAVVVIGAYAVIWGIKQAKNFAK